MAFPTGWSFKQAISTVAAKIPTNQTDFAVLMTRDHLDDDIVDPSGSNEAQADGGDLRFSSDSAGTTQLACEVVSFEHDTTTAAGDAEIQIWVKIPSLAAAGQDIYVWYNTTGTDTQPAVTDTYGRDNVWDANYILVLHLDEAVNTTTDGYIDSTGNGNDGTGVSMAIAASAGQIGDGQNFDGSADYISCSSALNIGVGFSGTLEFWATGDGYAVSNERTSGFPVGDGNASINSDGSLTYAVNSRGSTPYVYRLTNTTTATTTNWNQYALDLTVPNATGTLSGNLYVNGTKQTVTNTSYVVDGTVEDFNTIDIARSRNYTYGTNYLNGAADEVRLSDVGRLPDWITIQYNNQNSPSTFMTAGTPVAVGGVLPDITSQYYYNLLMTGR